MSEREKRKRERERTREGIKREIEINRLCERREEW